MSNVELVRFIGFPYMSAVDTYMVAFDPAVTFSCSFDT